jgi:non-heme chloroperoxidase
MPFVTTKDRTEIFHKDRGGGQPIAFRHDWPLRRRDRIAPL